MRYIIIRNPFNELDIKVNRISQKIRYYLISKLFTTYEKDQILTMFEAATDEIGKKQIESKYGLYLDARAFGTDILKHKLKSSW